jgi:hypothetical protein
MPDDGVFRGDILRYGYCRWGGIMEIDKIEFETGHYECISRGQSRVLVQGCKFGEFRELTTEE